MAADYYGSSSSIVLSKNEQVAIALIPKFTSFISICALIWIVTEVCYSKKKRNSFYHRLLAGLSVVSIIRAVALFLSTWPIPIQVPGFAFNVGTETSCKIQGFFVQFGLASPVYMTTISLYYCLTICCGWTESQMRQKECWFHILPWFGGLLTASLGLVFDLYQPADLYCWIGKNDGIYRLVLYYCPLWISFLMILYFFRSFYCSIREEEIKTLRYRHPQFFMEDNEKQQQKQKQRLHQQEQEFGMNDQSTSSSSPPSSPKKKKRPRVSKFHRFLSSFTGNSSFDLGDDCGASTSKQGSQQYIPTRTAAAKLWKKHPEAKRLTLQIASQVLWYVATFCVAHFWGSLYRLLQSINIEPYGLLVVMAIFDPLQGFLDFVVYRRPMFLRLRKQNPTDSIGSIIWKTIQWPGIERQQKRPGRPGSPSSAIPLPPTSIQSSANLAEEQKQQYPESNCFSTDDAAADGISYNDPLGALDDDTDEEDEFAIHQSEQQRLAVEDAISSGSGNVCMQPWSINGGDGRLGGFRKSILPNINESEVLEENEIHAAMQTIIANETEVDACLAREQMLERLSDLDIIEDVQEWVSLEVKNTISRQRSMPVIGSPYSNNANFIRGGNTPRNNNAVNGIFRPGLGDDEKGDDASDEDFMPPPPNLKAYQTM